MSHASVFLLFHRDRPCKLIFIVTLLIIPLFSFILSLSLFHWDENCRKRIGWSVWRDLLGHEFDDQVM